MSGEAVKPPTMTGSIKALNLLQQLSDGIGWMLTADEVREAKALRDKVIRRLAAPKPGPTR